MQVVSTSDLQVVSSIATAAADEFRWDWDSSQMRLEMRLSVIPSHD